MKDRDKAHIAKERIAILFNEAKNAEKSFADRYINIARKIAMKSQVRFTSEQRRRVCRHCYAYLKPGITSRIRLKKSKLTQFCSKCRNFSRFPYIKEIKSRRRIKSENSLG